MSDFYRYISFPSLALMHNPVKEIDRREI